MSEWVVDIDPETVDPFRAGTILSCLVIGLSYLLPWATVDGPGGEIDGSDEFINVSTTVQASVSPQEIVLFPELVVGVAVAGTLIAAFRWTVFWQFIVGVFGLGASFVALIAWAVVDADGQSEIVEVGTYAAIPSAFEPAMGLWFAIFGSLGLITCGFAAATRRYVRIKEASE